MPRLAPRGQQQRQNIPLRPALPALQVMGLIDNELSEPYSIFTYRQAWRHVWRQARGRLPGCCCCLYRRARHTMAAMEGGGHRSRPSAQQRPPLPLLTLRQQ